MAIGNLDTDWDKSTKALTIELDTTCDLNMG